MSSSQKRSSKRKARSLSSSASSNQNSSNSKRRSKKSKKRVSKSSKPSTPTFKRSGLNSYSAYLRDKKADMKSLHSDKTDKEIRKLLTIEYNALTPQEKEPWKVRANELNKEIDDKRAREAAAKSTQGTSNSDSNSESESESGSNSKNRRSPRNHRRGSKKKNDKMEMDGGSGGDSDDSESSLSSSFEEDEFIPDNNDKPPAKRRRIVPDSNSNSNSHNMENAEDSDSSSLSSDFDEDVEIQNHNNSNTNSNQNSRHNMQNAEDSDSSSLSSDFEEDADLENNNGPNGLADLPHPPSMSIADCIRSGGGREMPSKIAARNRAREEPEEMSDEDDDDSPPEPTFQCNLCQFTFESQSILNAHMNEIHLYQCADCPLKFRRMDELEDHMETDHNINDKGQEQTIIVNDDGTMSISRDRAERRRMAARSNRGGSNGQSHMSRRQIEQQTQNMEHVEEKADSKPVNPRKGINCHSFHKRKYSNLNQGKIWKPKETDRFYKIYKYSDTNFALMEIMYNRGINYEQWLEVKAKYDAEQAETEDDRVQWRMNHPDEERVFTKRPLFFRDQKQLRKKFKSEQKKNPKRLDAVKPVYDIALIKRIKAKVEEINNGGHYKCKHETYVVDREEEFLKERAKLVAKLERRQNGDDVGNNDDDEENDEHEFDALIGFEADRIAEIDKELDDIRAEKQEIAEFEAEEKKEQDAQREQYKQEVAQFGGGKASEMMEAEPDEEEEDGFVEFGGDNAPFDGSNLNGNYDDKEYDEEYDDDGDDNYEDEDESDFDAFQ